MSAFDGYTVFYSEPSDKTLDPVYSIALSSNSGKMVFRDWVHYFVVPIVSVKQTMTKLLGKPYNSHCIDPEKVKFWHNFEKITLYSSTKNSSNTSTNIPSDIVMLNAHTISLQRSVAAELLSSHEKWTKITLFVDFMIKLFVFQRKLYPLTLTFVQSGCSQHSNAIKGPLSY